jgi:hypothetical protein
MPPIFWVSSPRAMPDSRTVSCMGPKHELCL